MQYLTPWYEFQRKQKKESEVQSELNMLQKLSKCEVKAVLCWNWLFSRHSDFTWNPVLANSNGPKISFLAILETLNIEFWYIWDLKVAQIY